MAIKGIRKPIEYVVNENGCHNCVSHSLHKSGYPLIKWEGKTQSLLRVIYKEINGDITPEVVLRHTCDNPLCINLEHIVIGTQLQNIQDKMDRDRQAKGESNGRAKLTEEDVIAIRNLELSDTKTALMYGVTRRTITFIRNYKTWKHVA